ncbi:hypothetical protein AVEN_113182-2 [Araneus ventricosus]|uniref:Uncharacterized protein n=1 Tax=Araneus ventricosus TaxID=182803 RepID=A0A4Y2RWZ2_ARAVE|nr:hypothetical protein AVEN_113182-2 [Araneus ventricosus]
MDQNNNMVLPVEEKSSSSENTDVFDFKNLRNCLPMTNHKSGRISDRVQNIGRAVWRLMKIKALMNLRKEFSGLSHKITLLEKSSPPQRSACLDDASTSHETEKNLERPDEEALKRTALPCKLSEKQEKNNNTSCVLISNRRIINSKTEIYFEQRRAECHRNVSLVREKDRLRRACCSRGLSLENMNEPERDPRQQIKNHAYKSLVNDILDEKKKLQIEVEEATKLIQILKEQERQLAIL